MKSGAQDKRALRIWNTPVACSVSVLCDLQRQEMPMFSGRSLYPGGDVWVQVLGFQVLAPTHARAVTHPDIASTEHALNEYLSSRRES